MADRPPTLHAFCGKIAAGKTTLARQIAGADGAILVAEDDWLSALFGAEMTTPRDFVRYSGRLRAAMGPHLTGLMTTGLDVVLDFHANTVESRRWMRGIADAAGAEGLLHVLDPPEAVCLDRLRARNAAGTHPFTVSEAQFHQVSAHFVPPSEDEGFTLVRHG